MTDRRFLFRMFVPGILFLLAISAYSQEKSFIRKVVIDAGHGGKDPGAIGRKTQEKEITLAVALKLGGLIRENCKDVNVIYTRNSDEFIELFQRAEIANRNKADLFISIHCNANPTRTLQGSETYVMGLHKTKQNLEISKLENASILMEPDYLSNYDGFDPNSDESYITFTLFQNAFLNQSMDFASQVQKELTGSVGMADRGVRQAGFLVLYKTTMPSVLIETGFLSNTSEEQFLLSKNGQERISNAICKAFINYKEKAEKTGKPSTGKMNDYKQIKNEGNRKEEINEFVKPDTEKITHKDCSIRFRVQIAAYPTEIGVKNKCFKGLPNIGYYFQDKLYKYIVGDEKEVEGAVRLMETLRTKGFDGAFVVAFQEEKKIPVDQAKKILKEKKTK